ncbi:hypothetical protein [Streptomyces sp. OM5714]|uniref:hypothetical protein n=1 Tax=Streptomyces sp. OM5714 TaxID=2602736 RepID=UPI0013DD1377|nr:hypothetical protein [Streptomyces sp. OM5714]
MTDWQLLRLVGGTIGVIALAVFMTFLGLERADKLSSVLSLFVTVDDFVLSLVTHLRQKPVNTAVARGGAIATTGCAKYPGSKHWRNMAAGFGSGNWDPGGRGGRSLQVVMSMVRRRTRGPTSSRTSSRRSAEGGKATTPMFPTS